MSFYLYTLEKVRKVKHLPQRKTFNSKAKIMLGIVIDKKVTLKSHIRCLCKNVT